MADKKSASGVVYRKAESGAPLLDGFRAIYGGAVAKVLAFVAVIGPIASFHTIIAMEHREKA